MCGIAGAYGEENASKQVIELLGVMQSRGTQAAGLFADHCDYAVTPHELLAPPGTTALGHLLHAMVGMVPQPVQAKGVLVANCEIYNWKILAAQLNISANNDTEVLLHLLDQHFPNIEKALDQIDGVYAFAYQRDEVVIIARDILGVKPLWYSLERSFHFASERKALTQLGLVKERELYPRTIIQYNIRSAIATEIQRAFFTCEPEHQAPYEEQRAKIQELLMQAVAKRIPDTPFGLLLSGGVDSSTIALLLSKHKPYCYVVGNATSPDVISAKEIAKTLGLSLSIISPSESQVAEALPKIIECIEDANPVKVSVGATFWFACEQAQKDGCRAIFSGLGSEELFAGYDRHRRSTAINKECLSGLRKMHERDLYRDDVITMHYGIELRLPFLDRELVKYALAVPATFKITESGDKWILRDAALQLGVPQTHAMRPKKAAQYGSHMFKQIETLAKGHASVASYLHSFHKQPNKRLAALISGGKDSILALHIMHAMQYEISCAVTIDSSNPDSYMYHTPNTELVSLQARALKIPHIVELTAGDKEQELDALHSALAKAKADHGVHGVTVGAIQSQYQRERIEQVADELGLTVFAPLWQMDQEAVLNTLLKQKYEVIFTKVAADGLDETWLGQALTPQRAATLAALHASHGVHPAGEGGEFETLVLDAPLFTQRIVVEAAETIKDGLAATYRITRATLVPK